MSEFAPAQCSSFFGCKGNYFPETVDIENRSFSEKREKNMSFLEKIPAFSCGKREIEPVFSENSAFFRHKPKFRRFLFLGILEVVRLNIDLKFLILSADCANEPRPVVGNGVKKLTHPLPLSLFFYTFTCFFMTEWKLRISVCRPATAADGANDRRRQT